MRALLFTLLLATLSFAQTDIFEAFELKKQELTSKVLHRKHLDAFDTSRLPRLNKTKATNRKPVIFVAAMTGSRILGKLNYPSSHKKPGPFCWTKSDWYLLYAGTNPADDGVPQTLLPTNYMCTLDNLKVNLTTHPAKNVDGVQTKLPGETDVVTGNSSALIGWDYIIYKHQAVGYEWGVDMFAHPYDFRYAAEEFSRNEWPKLQAKIERAYNSNGNKKVVLQSLSMGGQYTSGFLSTMQQQWKDNYIDSWISLAGSLNGSTYNLGSSINGEDYGIPYVKKELFADMYSTWPSSIWVTPVAGEVNGIIAMTPSHNYSLSEIPQLMYRAGLQDVGDLKMKYYNKNSWNTAKDPGAKTYCWFSYNVPTVAAVRWKDDSLSVDSRDDVKGGGDGVVHYHGLRVCDQWKNTEVWVYEDMPHASEIGTDWVIDRIIKIVAGTQNCEGAGDEYVSDCGEECEPGDLEMGEEDCGFLNIKTSKRCLKILRWNCPYNCGGTANSCADEYDGTLVSKNSNCADEKKVFYEECKAYGESVGSSIFTYHGDAYPGGCFRPLDDPKGQMGFNYKRDSTSSCDNSVFPIKECFCRGQ